MSESLVFSGWGYSWNCAVIIHLHFIMVLHNKMADNVPLFHDHYYFFHSSHYCMQKLLKTSQTGCLLFCASYCIFGCCKNIYAVIIWYREDKFNLYKMNPEPSNIHTRKENDVLCLNIYYYLIACRNTAECSQRCLVHSTCSSLLFNPSDNSCSLYSKHIQYDTSYAPLAGVQARTKQVNSSQTMSSVTPLSYTSLAGVQARTKQLNSSQTMSSMTPVILHWCRCISDAW